MRELNLNLIYGIWPALHSEKLDITMEPDEEDCETYVSMLLGKLGAMSVC